METPNLPALLADLEAKRLAEEVAKLNRIEAEGRVTFEDPRLTLEDIATINEAARSFGVSKLNAYRRAKELGLLSYQEADRALISHPEKESSHAG